MSLRRLEGVFSVTKFRLPRRLQNVLQDVFKMSSRSLKDMLKTSWRKDVFKTNKFLLGVCLNVKKVHKRHIWSFSDCRFRACFEQGVPWHSANFRVWIHSETRMWHDKNIQLYLKFKWCLLRARSSLTFRQTIECSTLLK